jgi:hypothetical protein
MRANGKPLQSPNRHRNEFRRVTIWPDPMPDTRSENTLMSLLAFEASAFEAKDYSGEPGIAAPRARLPKLDERIAVLASTFSGPDGVVTVEMRAAARDQMLTAMAADLVDETTDWASRREAPRSVAAPVTFVRPRAVAKAPAQISAGFFRSLQGLSLQGLIASAAAPFTVRRLGVAAVPLVALLVAGSLWTQNWFSGTEVPGQAAPNPGAAANSPATRGLGPQKLDTVAEQNLETAIAAEEAAHGRSTPAVARELVDLAGLFRADGRYAEAQALCERALIIEDHALGRKNPETIRTINELAAVYRAQGRNKDADAILTRTDQP